MSARCDHVYFAATNWHSPGRVMNSVTGVAGASSKRSSSPQPFALPRLFNPPTLIEYEKMRFLVMDAPSESNVDLYLQVKRLDRVYTMC